MMVTLHKDISGARAMHSKHQCSLVPRRHVSGPLIIDVVLRDSGQAPMPTRHHCCFQQPYGHGRWPAKHMLVQGL